MRAVKDSVTLTMSNDEAAELAEHVITAHDHLEGYFQRAGDVEAGTPDAKLMDAMHLLHDFFRALRNASYA